VNKAARDIGLMRLAQVKSLLVILLVGGASVYNSDFASESVFASVLLPVVSVLSLIALALWVVILFHNKGIQQKTRSELGSGIEFPGDGFGDGG
jgi:hypothetical protein